MASLEEIIRKQKEHLTQAQIKALAQATERYKLLNAQRRAEAQSSLLSQRRQTHRGLQNMGLASREGKVISGVEKARNDALKRSYDTYDRQLRKIEEAQTQTTAARMVNANIEAQRRAAEEAAKKAAEEAAASGGLPSYKKPDLRGVGLLALQHGLETYNPMQHGTSENISYFKLVAQQNGLKGASANDYAVKMAADVANQKAAAASAFKPKLSTEQLAFASKYMSDPVNRFAREYGVNQEHMQELRKTNPEVLDTIRSTYKTIDEKQEAWNAAIAKGEGIVKLKNRNEYERWDDARKARIEMANAYSTLGRITLASEAGSPERNNPNGVLHTQKAVVSEDGKYLLTMPERTMYLLSDADFAAVFDAAERLYRKGQLSDEDFTRYESVKAGRELSSERAMKHGLVEPDSKYTSKYQQKNSMPSYWAGKDKPDGYTDEQWGEITSDHEYYVPLADPDVRSYDKKYGTEDSDYAGIVNYVSRMLEYNERAYLYTARGKMGFAHMRGENQHFIQSVVWYKDNVVKGETTAAGKYSKAEAISIAASYMTDEEIDRFNTILALYGAKEADDYFELLYETVLPARVNQAIDEDYDAMLRRETKYDENGNRIGSTQGKDTWALQITSTLLSTPLNIVEGILNPWMTAKTDLQDPTAARLSAREGSSAQEIRNAVQENFSNRGRFWYGVGTSTLDSMTVAAISGGLGEAFASMGVPAKLAGHVGSLLGGSILGGSAYNSSYSEALQRGLTPDKARATAFGNGLNEMLFESLSLDLLVSRFKTGDILKVSKNATVNWLVNTLVEAGVEGSEEVFTDMANNLWDKFINDIYSEELTKLRQYIASGMSYDEAKRKVNEEFAEQLWESFKAGAISGGVMGGGATFMGMVQNRGNEKVGKGLRQNSRVMNELRNFDYKSEYAQEILKQDKLTNQDVADLFNIMQQELLGQYKGDIQKAVADGKITQEQADLLKQYEQNGVQIVKDGKVVDNADGITVEQMPSVQDAIANLDNAARIQFLNNEEMRSLVQAVGGETAAVIEQSETAERDAEKAYRQTVREINNDTTLSPELKQKRLEAAKRTRQNARSEAEKIADTALTNKKGIGAKLETDGNGTVKVGKGSGKVTYDFSTKDNPGHQTVDSMTATEQSTLRIAKIVAASRGDVNVKVEAEFVGEHANENGYYDRSTNTIHINMSGDNSVLWTLSHELTHHLANTDTEAYAALRTAIETALKDSKLTTTELEDRGFEYDLDKVDPYIAREGNLWDALVAFEREEHGYGKYAEEEVVARCCESFLGFDQFVKDFARKQYKSAKAINKFIAQMNIDMQRVSEEARQSAAQRNVWNDESPENQILRQLTEIDRIANLWRIAVNAEAKKRQAAREETRASTKDSVKRSDTEYLDLARRYESGDKSVEAELRKAVDAAAKRAGYSIKAFHGTTENFNVFSRKQEGANHNGYLEFGAGFYFTPSETEAEQWVKRGRSGRDGKTPNVMSVYLNPMRMLSADESVPGGAKYLRTWLSQGEAEFIAARTYRFINYLIEDKGFSNVEAQETLKALGYDAIEATFKNGTEGQYVVFDPSQVKSADLITKDDNGNIIPLSERFKTDRTGSEAWKNEDIRFSMKDNVERKYTPETTMTMQQAKRMLEMTFNANGFRGYKGYKTADEWLQSEGAAEVAWYAENTDTVVDQYFNRFPELTDYEVSIEEVLEAYQKGTLVGKEKTAKETIDLKTGNGYKDSRFYAPKLGSVTEETIKTANLRVTSTNRDKVYAARRDVLFAAHTEEGIATLGLTQKELNKRLQNWSRYSERARTLSMKLNQGVAEEYWWTGLQNSSILSTINVTDQDIRSLVKDIIGTSSEYQRNYIGRTMLALDTHIDWSELTFEFTRTSNAKEGARGYYDDNNRHIAVGSSGYLNTVAHEMGHALDYKWGRDLFTKMSVPITQQHASNESKIASEEGRKFYHHFAEFSQKVEDACDIRSSYTQRGTEAFARFVARFVEWTANTAGSQSNYEAQYYNDRFTTGLYLEFVQILQEKARLDSMARNETRASKMDKVRLSTDDGTRTYTLGDVTAKMYGNDVELDGGKVRQRVQMMEAIAEVNGTARVDAASEEEAEAFRRAGAEQVTEELEGHGAKYGTWEFKYEERKFTNDSRYDIKQKQKFAKSILKQVGKSSGFTQAQRVKYGAALGRLMDYLWEMQYGKMDGKVIFEFADRLFDSILNDYTALSEADEEFRSELLANMTKTKNAKGSTVYVLEVNDKQMREIKYAYENAMAYASKLSKALGVRVTVKQTENAKTLEDIFTNSTDTRIKSDTNEGDMPGELLRIAQETESRKTNPYAAESEERRALKMGMFDAAMSAAGVEKSTAQQIREAVKETRKAERTKAKTEAKKAIDSARLAERMHEGALRAKDRRISENRERALKQHAADREAKLKQGFRETTQKANETRLKRDMRTIALKWNQRLVKLLANPTEASHVPVQLAREVAELTKTITEYIDNGTERGRINLEKVAKAYQQAFDDQATIRAAKEENRKYDPRGSVIDREMYDEQLVNMIDEMNEILADKSFKELSAREMMGLLNIIRGVAHTVYDANRMIGTTERKAIWQVGDQMVQELESAPKIKGGFARFFLEESLDLRRIAKVFSGSNENAEFVKLSDALNRGAIEKERVAQVLSGMFDPLTQQYGDEIRKWYGKNAEWIDTGITKNGRKVEITKGMRVSLAMHVLNTGNMRHIENGGVTIPNRELYAKGKLADAYANGTLVRLNADQINTIISQMTEAEKAYVVVAKEFFHQRTGYYVNKTSLQLLGYRKATVENYFPIHTDRNYTKTDFASVVRDGSIEGQGFLKERVMASNPVYLEDITSVVNRQIKGVSLYAGLAVPMRNFNAVMNASVYEDENGNWVPRTTVRKAMTQSMGEYGAKVVQGFLQDVSGMSAVDVTPGERIVAKLQTRYVKAVLLANLKVTLKQAASYPTAAAVIPWKYLGKALLKGGRNHRLISRADVDLINQYTPLYKMRRDGMANEITSIMAERGLEQKMPWLLGWITKMDVATVGRLWSAAEYMVADQQNLPAGSDEYYKAVAEVFNQTIQQTQPNFTPLQRNAALRSKNPVVRTLTLFGTQRMQNGGILIESAMELAHSKNMSKEAQAAAKAKFGRAVVSQLVQNVMLVAIGFVVDALRGRMKEWQDDDKDVTLESVAKVMGDQFLGNIFGSFLGGSELWDIISTAFKRATNANAYDTEFTVPSLDAIETIIGFFNKDSVSFVQYMSGDHTADEKITRLKNFSFKLAKAAGYLTGFPFENIAKTIVKGWIPALQDIYDATQTGELIPWLHQSGKLDKQTTNANYKEWTNNGFKGSEYFYWENVLSQYGKREEKIPILLEADLPNEKKAMLLRMMDKSGATSEGTVVYKSNGDVLIDFANPTEKQQALPMPTAETEETATPTTTPTATPKPTENPLTDARQEGVKEAVAKGVPEQTAFDAFLAYQNMGKNKSDDYSRNDDFRAWLFANVDSPEQRAVLEYQVIGTAKKVEGSVTYRESGVVFRDYTNESWFKLSEHNLSKDGTNKRYEAGKRLEKTGLSVDKTVAIYDALADYTKKAEWTDYLKEQGLSDEQINIFLWSRGWAKLN